MNFNLNITDFHTYWISEPCRWGFWTDQAFSCSTKMLKNIKASVLKYMTNGSSQSIWEKPMIPIRDEMKLSFFSICPNGSRENCHKCGKSFTPTHRIFLTKLISGKTSINCVPFLQISVINCDTIHKRMWHHFSKPSASLASQKPTLQFWPPWFWNLTNSSCVNLVKAGATQLDKGQKGQFSLLLAPLCLVSLHCTCCLWKTQFLMGVAFFTL